jgi:hypothetical protein
MARNPEEGQGSQRAVAPVMMMMMMIMISVVVSSLFSHLKFLGILQT